MNNISRPGKLILTGLLIFIATSATSQEVVQPDSLNYYTPEEEIKYTAPPDTSHVEVKEFRESRLTELKSNPDFNYKVMPTMAESLWERFLKWLGQFISALFEGATTTDWGRVFVYAAAFVGFIVILMMILRVNAFRIFYSGADRGTITSTVFHENIHELDFDKLLTDALAQKKYREGIRLLFLKALKILADEQLIHWQAGKTNHEYVEELKKGDLKINFNELSFYFDYAWYGNFSVNEQAFRKTETLFNLLKDKAKERQ